jgi:uncharacterized membrane protein (UPF0127 family)
MLERIRGAVALAAVILVAGAVAAGPGCRNGRPGGDQAPPSSVAAAAGSPGATTPAVILHGREARTIVVHVELASTEPERARGLMYRNHLEPDAGMLFLFPEPAPLAFWMKNTLIPLDMLFLDHDRRVVGIVENAAPETETPRRVAGQSQYVLEVGGGLSRQWGIEPGSTVEFRGLPAVVPTP